jgi:prepilin-type processing-associated H-X9-DG protein
MVDDNPLERPPDVANIQPEQRPTNRWRRLANLWYTVAAALAFVVFVCMGLTSVGHPPEASRRSQCKNNLKQIGLALHNYHERHGCFPPAYIADADGKPMHSWRVLLLPYLDQAAIYKQYRFDEPWDSPHNRLLAETVVHVFNCPSDIHHHAPPGSPHDTNYVAIIGDQTAWPGVRPMTFVEMKDGTSNTLMVVEVANSGIHWMEPRDLHVLQMAPKINAKSGQGISSRHAGGAHVLFADGSVRYMLDTLSEDVVRSLITVNGGEVVGGF